jgi:hypothetical protein
MAACTAKKASYAPGYMLVCLFVCLMVLNAIFNIISVLLVEETGGPGKNHRPVASH